MSYNKELVLFAHFLCFYEFALWLAKSVGPLMKAHFVYFLAHLFPVMPSRKPTMAPSLKPTEKPSKTPTIQPSVQPTATPTSKHIWASSWMYSRKPSFFLFVTFSLLSQNKYELISYDKFSVFSAFLNLPTPFELE